MGSKGNHYKYPEGWDKNVKQSVRKTADKSHNEGSGSDVQEEEHR